MSIFVFVTATHPPAEWALEESVTPFKNIDWSLGYSGFSRSDVTLPVQSLTFVNLKTKKNVIRVYFVIVINLLF